MQMVIKTGDGFEEDTGNLLGSCLYWRTCFSVLGTGCPLHPAGYPRREVTMRVVS